MAHIHTEPGQHDHTASMFVVRTDTERPSLMLHMHRILGKYMQFGGHVELHETPMQSMIHELREEAGYEPDQVRLLQPKERLRSLDGATLHPLPVVYGTYDFPGDHFHTDSGFILMTDQEPAHPPAEGESRDVRSFDAEAIAALPDDQIIANVRQISSYVLEHFTDFEPVPLSDFGI